MEENTGSDFSEEGSSGAGYEGFRCGKVAF